MKIIRFMAEKKLNPEKKTQNENFDITDNVDICFRIENLRNGTYSMFCK